MDVVNVCALTDVHMAAISEICLQAYEPLNSCCVAEKVGFIPPNVSFPTSLGYIVSVKMFNFSLGAS